MSTTTAVFGPDFVKDLITQMFQSIDEGKKQGFRMLWNASMILLKEQLVLIVSILFFVLLFSYLRAKLTGKWGL